MGPATTGKSARGSGLYSIGSNWGRVGARPPTYMRGVCKMILLAALIGLVPCVLMVIGVVSVFRAGVRLGRGKERRNRGR